LPAPFDPMIPSASPRKTVSETSSTASTGLSRRRTAAMPWRRSEGRRSVNGRNFTVRFRATMAGSSSGSPTATGTPATRSCEAARSRASRSDSRRASRSARRAACRSATRAARSSGVGRAFGP
jgi:hypothetical protein